MGHADDIFGDTLRTFRKRRIEPQWEMLDAPNAEAYKALFAELLELGITSLALSEAEGGLSLDASTRVQIMRELGRALPALGAGVISHVVALSLLLEATGDAAPWLMQAAQGGRFSLVGSPLDRLPQPAFELTSNGALTLSGRARVMLAYPDVLVVPARDGEQLRLCGVPFDARGVSFEAKASSHGLTLLPVGELRLERVVLTQAEVLAYPGSGQAAREADGLVTALLSGIVAELAERAGRYAIERYQGGKMISEHDAVRQLVGPIALAKRMFESLAVATLSGSAPGDGGTSAFAVEHAREAGLDGVQTFGGWGYMEDYRVERYLRDANTLETAWIHASARKRDIATESFRALSL